MVGCCFGFDVEHVSEEGNVKGNFYSLLPNYLSAATSLHPSPAQAVQYLSLSAAPHSLVTDRRLWGPGGGHTNMGKPEPFPSGRAFVAVLGMCEPSLSPCRSLQPNPGCA